MRWASPYTFYKSWNFGEDCSISVWATVARKSTIKKILNNIEKTSVKYIALLASLPSGLNNNNFNSTAGWTFAGLVRDSCEPTCYFLCQQSSHRWLIWRQCAAPRNGNKLSFRSSTYIFQPIAVENLGAFSCATLNFNSKLGWRIHIQSADVLEGSFLFQLISVAIQCFNSVHLHDTLAANLPDP